MEHSKLAGLTEHSYALLNACDVFMRKEFILEKYMYVKRNSKPSKQTIECGKIV